MAGKSFYTTGEIRTLGWDGPVTFDRLNALSDVSVSKGQGHVLAEQDALGRHQHVDPAQRPLLAAGKLPEWRDNYRAAALTWVQAYSKSPHKTRVRTREGEPIHMFVCLTHWGPTIEVFCRSWAAEPAGEIHVSGHKRLYFHTWEGFQLVCDQAVELCAPGLYQLGKAAERITAADAEKAVAK